MFSIAGAGHTIARAAHSPARVAAAKVSGAPEITCSMANPSLSFRAGNNVLNLSDDSTRGLKVETATKTPGRDTAAVNGTVERMDCHLPGSEDVEIGMDSDEVNNGKFKTDELGEFQVVVSRKNLSVHLRMTPADRGKLTGFLQDNISPTSPETVATASISGEAFQQIDANKLVCAIPGTAVQFEDGHAVVKGNFNSLLCHTPSNTADQSIDILSTDMKGGTLKTKDFGDVQIFFSLEDMNLHFKMKPSDSTRLVEFLHKGEVPPDVPSASVSTPAAKSASEPMATEEFLPLDPVRIACWTRSLSFQMNDGTVSGNVGELLCRIPPGGKDVSVALVSQEIANSAIHTQDFGDVKLIAGGAGGSLISLAMKAPDEARLEAFVKNGGVVQKTAAPVPEQYRWLDKTKVICTPAIPTVRMENGAIASGTVDKLVCRAPPDAKDIAVDLRSNEIVGGLIQTRDFGSIELVPGTAGFGSLSLAMKPADEEKLEAFLMAGAAPALATNTPNADPVDDARDACRNGKGDEAVAACTKLIEANALTGAELGDVYLQRGQSLAAMGQFTRAIDDYGKAIQANPEFSMAFFDRGVAYTRTGQRDLSIADFDRALALKPDFVEALGGRGNVYMMKGQYARAVEDFNLAIKLKPDYAAALYMRGMAKLQLADQAGSTADIETAKKLDPQYGH